MKIAFFEIKKEEQLFFEKHLAEKAELFFFEGTVNEVLDGIAMYDVISVFVHSKIDAEILQKLPNLRYIQTRSTGYDHIKCQELYKSGLLLSNVAGYGGPAVAEFAFSLLLNATRHTNIAISRAKEANYQYNDLKGVELFSKKIGILGLGTIGQQMARIAKGFGMDVFVYSRSKKAIVDELELHFCSLDELFRVSDIIMLALPLTPATKHILNIKNYQKLKKDVVVVNTARGELIEDKLYEVMSENIFCLDVIENQKYISADNILYTPHIAYYTQEALQRIMQISLQNIEAFLSEKPLPNCLQLKCKKDYQ